MEKFVISSMRKSYGKTSVVVGLAEAMGKRIGYMKPLGDRIIYRDKRAWDHDAMLMSRLYGLKDDPEDVCFGFDHSKLNYMYDDAGMKKKLLDSVAKVGRGKDALFIETSRNMMQGTFIHLGAFSVSKHTGAKLIVVLTGDNDSIVDDAAFLKKYVDMREVSFGGIIVNKVNKLDEFEKSYLPKIEKLGINVIGALPYTEELNRMSAGYIAESISAKVVTGEQNLGNVIDNILIGAMYVDAPLQKILSERRNKLIITSGDRTDMILAALESDTEAVVLTNNILPPPNIISKADEKGVPMLLVQSDTFKTAKQIDDLEPLLTPGDRDKIKLLGRMVKQNLDVKAMMG
jgi:BioD-like phosphotransacetylase family protein